MVSIERSGRRFRSIVIALFSLYHIFLDSAAVVMRSIKEMALSVLSKVCEAVIEPRIDRASAKRFQERRRVSMEWRNTRRANWNASLPPIRSDTMEVSALSAATDGFSTQPQCSFFTKLPPELRTMIYPYALGNEELEVDLIPEEKELWIYHDQTVSSFDLKCAKFQQLMAFPGSCKIAYVSSPT